MLQLHTCCAENRPQRPRRPPLLPDHLANIALRDAQSNDSGIAFCDGLDGNIIRIIYQGTSYLGYKFCHVLYRILPCRKLRCRRLSHYTHLQVLGVTKNRSRLSLCLVYGEIFQEMLERAKHRSQTVQQWSWIFCFAKFKINRAIPRSLRETVCRTYRRESSSAAIFGNQNHVPKVSGIQVTFYAATTVSVGFSTISFPTRSDNCAPLLVQ